ncbi:DEAD/DEAH box helicase family protein [Chryseobacterium ginsengisoli]
MKKKHVTPFNNTPINFKQINASDFEGFYVEGNGKTIIEPRNGYISEPLLENIDLGKKDTTIINASVGQGKTTAVIKFVEWYYKTQDYIIVIAAPFKSLIEQYESKIKKESGLDNIIFNYQNFEDGLVNRKNFNSLHQKPIQILTINSLLGNPGKIALKQSDIKREYFESLINYAEDNGKKIVLILDEIHESIHNFKETLIFNLFKWNSVVHKTIVLSATFNEASKVVIKYLAEMTDKKIKIIESARHHVEDERLSDLHLCIYDSYHYKANSQIFESLFIDEGKKFDKIHILSYSQSLAEDIHKSDLGNKLNETFGEFNLCISKNNQPFDETICNIGTVFKTGISIEDENCGYFIILPPKSAQINNNNTGRFGIFTEGIFNIIQAVARPRVKANIYIIMPSPQKLIKVPKIPENYIKVTSLDYLPFDDENNHSPYYDINSQDALLKSFYFNLRENQDSGEQFVNSKTLDIVPIFPEYEKYKLTEGEKYYRNYYEIFGKNLSDYVYWAAWNNQFVNCKLRTISKVSLLLFSYGNVQNMLNNYYGKTFSKSSFFVLNSDKDCYIKFRSSLYSNNIIYKPEGETEYKSITPYRNSNFEQQIIAFIQRNKRVFNFDFRKKIYPPDGDMAIYKNGSFIAWKTPIDIDSMHKETYLRLAMLYSIQLEYIPKILTTEETALINAYKILYSYKDILLSQYTIKSKKGDLHLPIDSKIDFRIEHQIELNATIENLRKYDKNLKIFSFLQKSKNLVPIYKLLKDLFFVPKTTTITPENSTKKIKVNGIELIDFPKKNDYINLIYSIDDAWILQSGNGNVTEEHSNDPLYWNFE